MRIATLSAAALLLLCFACGQAAAQTPKPFSVVDVSYTESHTLVYFTSNKSYGYVSSAPAAGETVAVVVDRNPTASGWDYIRFTADAAYVAQNQSEAFYAVGFAEGVLTSDSIYSSYVTSMSEDGLPWLNTLVADGTGKMWLDNHVAFMRNLGNTNTSTYGVMVKSLLRQIDGLYDGYNAAVRNSSLPALTWTQMFLISFQSEISRAADGAAAIYSTGSSSSGTSDFAITRMFPNLAPILGHSKKRRAQGTHCSALVRTTGDDVLLAHDTWSSYNTMVRQYKTYTFGTTYSVTMSGYPASLSSIDDWYMTQSKLAVTETSIDLETNQLDSLVRPESVSEFMRAMLANYLASSAPEWALIFSDHNSGTYNNQYMILDTKLAAQKLSNQSLVYNTLLPDTFWVLEQSPGLIVKEDQTDFLNTNKHWPSYNIPFYEQIYNRSGFAAAEISTGSLNNYTTYARARLFKRLFESVVDVASMYHVMRYNEWRTDEESLIPWCVTKQYGTCTHNRSAMLSIASRGDLAPADEGEGPGSVGGQPLAEAVTLMNLGAIDTKITSVRNMMGTENIGFAINGPTSQSQPIFNTTAFIAANSQPNGILEGVNWRGVPSYFDFPFSRFLPEMETPAPLPTMAPTPGPKDDNDDSKSRVAIAVGVVAGVGVVGGGSIFAYRKFSRSKHEIYEGEESPLV